MTDRSFITLKLLVEMQKTILITGASKGFGRVWTEAFLEQGYQVAASARNVERLNDLKDKFGHAIFPIQLDVTNRAQSFEVVKDVKDHFGSIDVLINNAGLTMFGAIEEFSEEEAKAQFETNFFGLLNVTQAVLPIMREQKNGHIIQVSSILGLVTLPILGLYNATKFAVEGLSETLASEVAGFGINISIVEPNGYETDIWGGTSAKKQIEAYNPVKKAFQESASPDSYGKIEATKEAMLNLVESSKPPLRLLLGKVGLPFVKQVYEQRMAGWTEWKEVSEAAHGK